MRGHLMDVLELDIETRSTVDITSNKSNVYAYTECPEFRVLMCGWSLNDSPIEVWEDEPDIRRIPGLFDPDVKKVAHNAAFERVCLSRLKGLPVGTYIEPEQYYDTAAVAALHGLPRSLDALAKALKVTAKDSAGTRLINLFSVPHKGVFVRPEDRPEEWKEFKDYCAGDVKTMQEVRRFLPGWPADGFERQLWYVDQRINDRGLRVDVPLAAKAVDVAKRNSEALTREVIEISGVKNPNSVPQVRAWLEEVGEPMPNLQKATVDDALSRADLGADVRRVLELRQEIALVAHRKFEAALRGVSGDGRLRGQFKYHGAHTARWSAGGVQVHNMPRLAFEYKDEDGEKHYDVVAEDVAISLVLAGRDVSPETLKMCVRPMFLGPLSDSDFSAIEARVLAWIAGEAWVLQAFVEGRDLYVETAERMGGGMGRPEGKIAVLAAGYQGSIGTFRKMGYGGRKCAVDQPRRSRARDQRGEDDYTDALADLDLEALGLDPEGDTAVDAYLDKARDRRVPVEEVRATLASHVAELARDPGHKDDAEILELVRAWRQANENIRQFWYDLERAFWSGGVVGAGHVRVERDGSRRKIHLPSGRVMTYHGVHRRNKTTECRACLGTGLADVGSGCPRCAGMGVTTKQEVAYRTALGTTEGTYGGKLTENVTQAIARDLLADALIRLDAEEFPVVGHIHDEAIADYEDEARAARMHEIMSTAPAWAADMPMDASIEVLERYRKT